MREPEERTIILTRESFCIGDDATAPNKKNYTWQDRGLYPESELYGILEDYLGTNLPGYFWRGYASGKKIVDVVLQKDTLAFTRKIMLVTNWRELLRESRAIHFIHSEYENRSALPATIESEM